MDILFITPCLSYAGAEKILCWVAESMSMAGERVHILDLQLVDNCTNFHRLIDQKVHVHRLATNKKQNSLTRLKGIVELIRKHNIKVVSGFTRYPCILATVAGYATGAISIISERGDPYQFEKGFRNNIETFILNHANGCVFQTEMAKLAYNKKLQERSIIIPNPVLTPTEIRWRKDHTSKTIVTIGRLDNQQKRIDVAINAFKEFLNFHPEYHFKIYGSGPDEGSLKKYVKDCNLQDYIDFFGPTSKPIECMARCEIFLITSDFEGIPNTLIEAMSIGMPVVATDCSPGGAKLLIDNGKNGYLCPKGDAHSVAIALRDLADNHELMEKFSNGARIIIDRYNPDILSRMWIQYFRNISSAN